MNSSTTAPKISEKELNQVFVLRKKVGTYKSIPLDVKTSMMDLFLKVSF